jgi:Leucine-rich repeat (LRR) protein
MLPLELAYLSDSLATLDLGQNSLTSHLAYAIGAQLSNLQELRLDNNSITGRLPTSLGKLASIRYLYLQYNAFSGPVPTSLSSLSSLSELNLSHNNLTGSLPGGICQISSLSVLNIDCRELQSSCWTTCTFDCGGTTGIVC